MAWILLFFPSVLCYFCLSDISTAKPRSNILYRSNKIWQGDYKMDFLTFKSGTAQAVSSCQAVTAALPPVSPSLSGRCRDFSFGRMRLCKMMNCYLDLFKQKTSLIVFLCFECDTKVHLEMCLWTAAQMAIKRQSSSSIKGVVKVKSTLIVNYGGWCERKDLRSC